MSNSRILLVEDEDSFRRVVGKFLRREGFRVDEAVSCGEAEEQFRSRTPDVVILDYALPDGTAFPLLGRLRKMNASIPVVILTGHASIDLAVRAIKEGAEEFLKKPIELPALLVVLRKILDDQRNRRKKLAGKSRQSCMAIDPFAGVSPAIAKLREQAERMAKSDSPVLIQGETGTGKGVLAQWLHHNGRRAEESLVDLNCAGLTRDFLETELFGHTRGAFTGAHVQKLGLLELAHRGTVFLDEIGDMDTQVQPKLLKALEEKRFRRLGDVRDCKVDIRLISATHQDLKNRVEAGLFRGDLYFRVSTLPLWVPPLRDRVEDIPILSKKILDGLAKQTGGTRASMTTDAVDTLTKYSWPGNIRELRNVLERAILLSDDGLIQNTTLMFDGWQPTETPKSDMTLLDFERSHIERALVSAEGHVGNAARRLGVPRSTLYEKIKKYRLERSKEVAV